MRHLVQSLQLGYTISGAGLRVNNIYISMFPGGLWVQLLNDNGVEGCREDGSL